MAKHLLQREKFTSIQKAQAGLTRLLASAKKDMTFYRVLRGSKPVGILLPNSTWESLVEDLVALSSLRYLRAVFTARKEKKFYGSAEIKRQLSL